MLNKLRHWQLSVDENHIAWLQFKYADGHANILNHNVFSELEELIEHFSKETPKGIIITSGHDSGFIAGADINEFSTMEDPKIAYDHLRYGQEIFSKFEALSCPTIALVNGFCLGGGMEFILSCRYRIALDDPKTRFGFPEVQLGIHPGWGGCERAPKLLGAPAALDLILTGRTIDGKTALRIGLVDALVPLREFTRAGVYFINKSAPKHELSWWKKLSNADFVRPLLARYLRKQLHEKVNEKHYPAPYAALELWEKVGPYSEDAYVKEAESVSRLALLGTTKNLIRVYFLRERLKKMSGTEKSTIKKVHVIGAGTMGGDIAAVCALYGFEVTVQDQALPMLAKTEKRANTLFSKKIAKNTLRVKTLDNLILDTTGEGVKHADLIIEAIPETLELKQKVWNEVEKQAKPSAILATNTSSIPLTDISRDFKNPARLIGLHFFNPVEKMPLVEVVNTPNSDQSILNAGYGFVKRISKLALPTHSSPGFLVNRVLLPYLLESVMILNEGTSAEQIDKSAVEFGMPMGPIAMSDAVGLDVCLAVAEHLAAEFGWKVPEGLREKVAAGHLGKKTGQGFYRYTASGKLIREHAEKTEKISDEKIAQRIIMRLLNEAVACLREKIVADADLVDAGLIFGAGFVPFLGGPLHYAKQLGIDTVVTQLEALTAEYGERFKPDAGWRELSW